MIWAVTLVVERKLAAHPTASVIGITLGALAIPIGVSMISDALLEAPFLRLKDRFFARSATNAVASPLPQAVAAAGPFHAA